jgi:hypothetical protein
MGMKQTIDVINGMEAEGIISRYAIAGAIAAFNYIEPTFTEDLDLLVSFDERNASRSGLLLLAPVISYLKSKGYQEYHKESVVIEGWPVQFLPVSSRLDLEALSAAQDVEVHISEREEAFRTRVLLPEHIVAIALRVGRPKDHLRMAQFIESQAVNFTSLCEVLRRHDLTDAWRAFCRRAGIEDPCKPE